MRGKIFAAVVVATVITVFGGCGGDKKVEERVGQIQSNAPEASAPVAAEAPVAKKADEVATNEPKTQNKSPETAKVPEAAPALQGKSLFDAKCTACHGQKGEGKGSYPKLAGLSKEDALKMLKGYVDGSYGKAQKVVMTGQAKSLDDAQKEAVAEYISSLK